MSQTTKVELFDDLDGSPATNTVKFGWEGKEYEIDLNEKHAGDFAKAVKKYLEAARELKPMPKITVTRSMGGKYKSHPEAAKIRDWAAKQGFTLSDKGRIPFTVMRAYEKASV